MVSVPIVPRRKDAPDAGEQKHMNNHITPACNMTDAKSLFRRCLYQSPSACRQCSAVAHASLLLLPLPPPSALTAAPAAVAAARYTAYVASSSMHAPTAYTSTL